MIFARHSIGRVIVAFSIATITVFSSQAMTVSEGEAKKAALHKPAPTISAMARQLKISGHVEVSVQIDEAGNVADVKALVGNPLLTQGCIDAVKKWKFTPFTEGGSATKATATLSFDFKQ